MWSALVSGACGSHDRWSFLVRSLGNVETGLISFVVDDHSRLAYVEIDPDENGATAAGFLHRATAFYVTFNIRL